LGECRFGVGFGEVGLPFRRARELWKKRIEERSFWRSVGLRRDGRPANGSVDNVVGLVPVTSFRDRVVVKVLRVMLRVVGTE
jgi:hypothetical protein